MEKLFVIEWRSAGERAVQRGSGTRSMVEKMLRDAAEAGQVLDDECRISPLGMDGCREGRPIYTDRTGVENWAQDAGMPAQLRRSAWRRTLRQASLRPRVTRAVARCLTTACRARLLEREQAADIVRMLDQAFERVGQASNRLPPR